MVGYTKKEIAMFTKALNALKKCYGDCKHCEKCHMYTSKNGLYYAFGCDILPKENFAAISNSMKELRMDAINQLEFELS